jgi:hypothetical protein
MKKMKIIFNEKQTADNLFSKILASQHFWDVVAPMREAMIIYNQLCDELGIERFYNEKCFALLDIEAVTDLSIMLDTGYEQ